MFHWLEIDNLDSSNTGYEEGLVCLETGTQISKGPSTEYAKLDGTVTFSESVIWFQFPTYLQTQKFSTRAERDAAFNNLKAELGVR